MRNFCKQTFIIAIFFAVPVVTAFAFGKKTSSAEQPQGAESTKAVSAGGQFVDPYTGWTYTTEKRIDYTHGHILITLRGDQGSFGLYALSDNGRKTPLLNSYDFFGTSAFSLRIGRKEYKLNYEGGIESEARRTDSGVQMVYKIPGKAYFLVDFSFPEDGSDTALSDSIRVSLYTVNLGDSPQTFTVKGIFDTILGESSGKHFSTALVPVQNRQKQFHGMQNDRWIQSENGTAAIQFLFSGADISEPESVTLGAYDSLSQYWVPDVHEAKSYNTVLVYNNSGIAVNWKTAYLMSSQMDVKTFYITVAEGVNPVYVGNKPAGDELIASLESGKNLFPDCPQQASDSADRKNEAVELSPAAQAITEEQLDPEYVQNLIDYIESIKSEEDIDQEEFNSLNAELDAIFEKMRSMGL